MDRPAETPALSTRKKALFALILLVGLLVLAEPLLMLAGVQPARFASDPYVGFQASFPLFVKSTGADGESIYRTAPEKTKFFNDQQFPTVKPAGAFRIFCLGGSTTQGFPYGDATSYPGWLRAFLPAADPSRSWDVLNCGAKSYASYRVAKLMEELVGHEPDLFIVYSAHNEFLERRTYKDLIERPSASTWMDVQLSRLRTYSLIKSAMGSLMGHGGSNSTGADLLPEEVDAILETSAGLELYERDDALRAQVVDHYAFNLRRMVQMARSVNAEIILIRPARNVLDCMPFKSEHREGLTPADLARWDELFRAGLVSAAKGDLTTALAQFEGAAAIDDRYAELAYEMGRAYFALGRYDDARQAFDKAIDEDICPVRAPTEIDDAQRRVADEEDVAIIDFRGLLERRSQGELGHAVLGAEYFVDHVHTTVSVHRMLAEAILAHLIEGGAVRPPPGWEVADLEAVASEVYARIDPEATARANRLLARTLAHAGNLAQADRLGRHGLLFQSMSEFALAEDCYRQAASAYTDLLGRDHANVTTTLYNLATVLFAQGKLAEAEPIYVDVLARQRRQFGDDHPTVRNTVKYLTALRQVAQSRQDGG